MDKIFIAPYLYFFKTRLKGMVQKLSWLLIYFVPSLVLYGYFSPEIDVVTLILWAISITMINYVYENGYIQNDILTIRKENNPTLRLSKEETEHAYNNFSKIVSLRLCVFAGLAVLFYAVSLSFSTSLALLGYCLLLQVLYVIYNNVRNIWNLILLLPINYLRFYGFILPLVPTNEIFLFLVMTAFLYPVSKVIEFTKRERFGLTVIGDAIGNVDRFRIFYYFFVLIVLSFLVPGSIYFYIALYYLAFRSVSYIAVSKSSALKKNSRTSSFIKTEESEAVDTSTAQFGSFERRIAFVLTKFPKLKLFAKKSYQKINYIKHKKDYSFKSNYVIKRVALKGRESFFGYYDKSPINANNKFIVFQSPNSNTSDVPDPKVPLDIVLYDVERDHYAVVGSSSAYNWQQGSKLMWIDDYKFIYNDFEEQSQRYVAKVYDIKSMKTCVVDYPIYDCYGNNFGISLNFERLGIARQDYNYSNLKSDIDWSNNSNDGLYYIDLEKNSQKLILTIENVINFNYKETMKGAKHKFNHIMISPDGARMMFMHRWFLDDGRRYDSLYVCNVDGTSLTLIADDDMVSHCYWYDNNQIFAYLRDKNMGDKYYLIDIENCSKQIIGEGKIDNFGDGHPSSFGTKILFDTYPDKSRMKSLLIYDVKNDKLDSLGQFLESFKYYGETRCDLHPRFSFDGNTVFFDSVHEGSRSLYYIELNK